MKPKSTAETTMIARIISATTTNKTTMARLIARTKKTTGANVIVGPSKITGLKRLLLSGPPK